MVALMLIGKEAPVEAVVFLCDAARTPSGPMAISGDVCRPLDIVEGRERVEAGKGADEGNIPTGGVV